MCGSMVDIQFPAAEIRRGKKEDRRKKLQGKNIMAPLLHRAAIMTALTSVVILISRLECIGVHFAQVSVLVSRPQCQSLHLHLAAMVSVFQGAAVFFKMSTRNETK